MKRGQIAVFVIVGLVILLLAAVFFALKDKLPAEAAPQLGKALSLSETKSLLSESINSCLKNTAIAAYYKYGENAAMIQQYINDNLANCVDFSQFRGVEIKKGNLQSTVEFIGQVIYVELDFTVTISSSDSIIELSKFNYYFSKKATIKLPENEAGVVSSKTIITSPDSKAELIIPEGTIITDSNGNPVKEISLELSSFDKPDETILGGFIVYDAKPSGAKFSQPVELRIKYDDSGLLPDQEKNIDVVWFDEPAQLWKSVPSVVDPAANVVYSSVEHFSQFASSIKCKGNDYTYYFDTSFMYIQDCEPCNCFNQEGDIFYGYNPSCELNNGLDENLNAKEFSDIEKLPARGGTISSNKGCELKDWNNNDDYEYGYDGLPAASGAGEFKFTVKPGSCVGSIGVYKASVDDALESVVLKNKNGEFDLLEGARAAPDELVYGSLDLATNRGNYILSSSLVSEMDKKFKDSISLGENSIVVKTGNLVGACSHARLYFNYLGNGACVNQPDVGNCCILGNCDASMLQVERKDFSGLLMIENGPRQFEGALVKNCKKGADLGVFGTTYYDVAFEGNFENWKDFCWQVEMQGGGVDNSGNLYRAALWNCGRITESSFRNSALKPEDAKYQQYFSTYVPGRTVATSEAIVKKGEKIYLDFSEDAYDGVYVAEDTGYGVTARHLDVYVGIGTKEGLPRVPETARVFRCSS